MPEPVKIVIVEDSQAIVDMYKFKLETEGYQVTSAGDGIEGYDLIERERPDVILLDLMLPFVQGAELLQKVRVQDWGKDIKVLVMTNINRSEAPKELDSLGIDRYIIKALSTPHEVSDEIKAVLAE